MRRTSALLVAVLAALTVSACGSDGDTKAASSPSPSVEASPSTSGPADPVAAEVEVRKAWEGFFNGAAPAAGRAAFLERAGDLAPALALAGKDPNAGKTSAKVTAVAFSSATEATVTYDLSSAGTVVLPGAQGKAVIEGGAWKVSAQTFCQLTALAAAGKAVPGC